MGPKSLMFFCLEDDNLDFVTNSYFLVHRISAAVDVDWNGDTTWAYFLASMEMNKCGVWYDEV